MIDYYGQNAEGLFALVLLIIIATIHPHLIWKTRALAIAAVRLSTAECCKFEYVFARFLWQMRLILHWNEDTEDGAV